ncbi:MAG: lipoyl synthase [Actinobacteria bacterium]|nr:lipoyl synthase [Actinomycetota bacterium]
MSENNLKKPKWLKKTVSLNNSNINQVQNLLTNLKLNTVCQSAKCPNIFECFSKKTATFLLMGNICTRNCAFCGVKSGKPQDLDKFEPENIAKAVQEMGLNYIVLTSVTRDDLEDGGAKHFAKTVQEIKSIDPNIKVECLIPDFKGSKENLKILLDVKPDVLNHNLETIKVNYKTIRHHASYNKSLDILRNSKDIDPEILTKSGFMLGLGEEMEEILELLQDLENINCDIVTIGQYLRPSKDNYPVQKYYSDKEFEKIKKLASNFNFKSVVAGIFVRSSYEAASTVNEIKYITN